MTLLKIGFLFLSISVFVEGSPYPGHHHVRHRIHVPTKVKTVYQTKIIKVPEHHHYYHEKEKEKVVPIPEHHHYFHEKDKKNDLHDIHKHIGHDSDYGYGDDSFGSNHNIFKKHAPPPYKVHIKTYLKQRKSATS